MRYVMKQKLWSFGDDFSILDEAGTERFRVDGQAFSIGDKLSFPDVGGEELAFVRQKLLPGARRTRLQLAVSEES